MRPSGHEVRAEIRQRMHVWYRTIDGHELLRAAEAGLIWLRTNQQILNELNVFPVPDGDTGTNMVLTMQSAWNEVESFAERSLSDVAHALAQGALMGARGNSGVILSQLWRGFSRAVEGLDSIDANGLSRALGVACDTAYRGVVRPVEGTILTVSKDIAEAAEAAQAEGVDSILELLERIVTAAELSVERTQDLLPVLKEAGVVDAGGKGLFFLLEGALRAAFGRPLDKPLATVAPLSSLNLDGALEAIEPGQDWEVVVDFEPDAELDLQVFYERLDMMGTSIQVGEGDGMYRIHIHVPDTTQYEPIEYIRGMGTIQKVALENLMTQSTSPSRGEKGFGQYSQAIEPGEIAVLTVAPGAGIARIFAGLGAGAVIRGGQTMNPSTREILTALEELPTDKVVILPNNKNVQMAAEQAAELTSKRAVVVSSEGVPQGIAAMVALNPDGDLEDVVASMNTAIQEVSSAELTFATRSVLVDGVKVQKGQVIGLLDGRLVSSGEDLEEVMLEVLGQADAHAAELITLYYGEDIAPNRAKELANRVENAWPELSVEVHEGGQPHYALILSIE